jgi:hypothetical protein
LNWTNNSRVCFNNKFYFDKCLPFGASISCSLFEKISTALHWCTEQKTGNKDILRYLDELPPLPILLIMSMASSMLEYLTMQNSGSMKSLTEFWVGYERLWISRKSPFFFLTFRLLRVSPSDFDQLGFSFDNKFYFDKCLPFGASKDFCRLYSFIFGYRNPP